MQWQEEKKEKNKKTNNDRQDTHEKLNIEQHEPT